ncbi:hypothetical protein [Deinococcus alpinitundrae]|uniref:hypothetical protein n=1 Tax=Deinococcus alpinitundrae TaxID=468913 RepID=UPI00137A1246|nr:hypothetical protein [Deinococcus alpinitundrae]
MTKVDLELEGAQDEFKEAFPRLPMTPEKALQEALVKSLDVILIAAQGLLILTGRIQVRGVYQEPGGPQ